MARFGQPSRGIGGLESAASLLFAVLYRIIHALNAGYALAVFWLYVAAFGMALSTIFFFPPAAVFSVFLGLLFLGPALIGGKILRWIDRTMTRTRIAQGLCPSCGHRAMEASANGDRWHCAICLATYQTTGELAQQPAQVTPL